MEGRKKERERRKEEGRERERKRSPHPPAVVCARLCVPQAGPRRSRQLALLYKDERAIHLDVFPVLEKMCARALSSSLFVFLIVLILHVLAFPSAGSWSASCLPTKSSPSRLTWRYAPSFLLSSLFCAPCNRGHELVDRVLVGLTSRYSPPNRSIISPRAPTAPRPWITRWWSTTSCAPPNCTTTFPSRSWAACSTLTRARCCSLLLHLPSPVVPSPTWRHTNTHTHTRMQRNTRAHAHTRPTVLASPRLIHHTG